MVPFIQVSGHIYPLHLIEVFTQVFFSIDLLFHNFRVLNSFRKVTAMKADTITLDLIVTLSVQHYYSVRIFPGQEPSSVWVGWVTSDFHQYDPSFELHNVRTVTVTLGDEKGKVHER